MQSMSESINTKARSDSIRVAARLLLVEHNIQQGDALPVEVIRHLASELAARINCHPTTARRHLVAVHTSAAVDRGGIRSGAGRPQGKHEHEPWRVAVPSPKPDRQRYQRALALSGMHRNLLKLGDKPRYARRAVYWQQCIDNWQAYLDGKIKPPNGRMK
jgi:hypothetical protein